MTRPRANGSDRPAGRVAVIDLGSNSVRLVVFDGLSRTPVPVFNEGVVCGLGRGLRTSGRLAPDGVALALGSLGRFIGLARAMAVARIDILATAAVREAADGADFVADVERRFGVAVRVLSGAEESRLAALGIVWGLPKADGLMGDLGGGSLDLVAINEGAFGEHDSLPLGLLWLSEAADGDLDRARRIVEQALDGIPWLAAIRGRTVFPVGGAWRTLASISINQSGYPLHILDNYALGRDQAVALLGLIAGLGRRTLEKIPGVSRRRLGTLPMAALLLERLIDIAQPARIAFSAQGVREGQFVSNLAPGAPDEDVLLGACAELARRHPRSGVGGTELWDWIGPLFAGEDGAAARLRLAACHLSDIAWAEHPDYRGAVAHQRVLHLPFAGLSHEDRAMLALSVHLRYDRHAGVGPVARLLLDEDARARASVIGASLRLAHTMCGGIPDILNSTALKVGKSKLTLVVPADGDIFDGEVIERRVQAVARALGLEGQITRNRG
ncbi:MAG: hypothetical protein QGI13_16215 [Rhodospirillales bacterium]|jgi:exopolyphosphatase/guanosine-5'-triphosphate,3'-diphosphate pyrophosphatase|nr:hypothetical protein [Rhodospirillales bacterium]